jgi:hypothetical protein
MNALSAVTRFMNPDVKINYLNWKRWVIPPLQIASPSSNSTAATLQAATMISQAPLIARFRRLADQWIADTENISVIEDMIVHPAYQEIIGMGPAAITMLLDEIEREPNHWFVALYAVSGGQNPVPPEHAGNIDQMIEDWIEWAESRNYR